MNSHLHFRGYLAESIADMRHGSTRRVRVYMGTSVSLKVATSAILCLTVRLNNTRAEIPENPIDNDDIVGPYLPGISIFSPRTIISLPTGTSHHDHDAAVAQIKSETGARLMVMEPDVASVERTEPDHLGAKVDRVLHDGDIVEIGESKLTARLTPGHTPGCTTWTMEVQEGGRKLNAVIIGSPNVNPGYILVGNTSYPQIAQDYEKTFAVLLNLPVDLFLGAHGSYFDLQRKYEEMKPGGPNPFIDPTGYKAYVTERRDVFRKERDRQKEHPGSPAL